MVRFGVFDFDPETGDLWKDGRRTRLQDQARVVLRVLVDRPGELVTRDELRKMLWADDTFVDIDTGLNVVITKIRQALDDSASAPRFVETLPRRGYRFIAPIAVAIDAPRPSGRRRQAWVAVIALAAALATAGLFWFRADIGRASALPQIRAVAVLPLENLSGDEAQTYLVDGIAEALTTDLASIRSLRVVSRQSMKHYRGTTKSIADIGRELDVDALIGGSVARSGDRIRLTVQLIDAAGDRHLWAQSFEQDRRDIVRLQRDAAQELARAMRVIVTPGERARIASSHPVNPEAYDAYLRGRYLLAGLAESEEQTSRALAEFQRAVEIDPQYAMGYVGIATAQQLRATVFQGQPPSKLRAPAISAARQALKIDPSLGEAHGILARLQLSEFDWPGAEDSFRRALDLAPGDAAMLVWYAYQLIWQGRFDEALEVAMRAEAIDPLDLNTRVRVAHILMLVRKPNEAISRYQEVLSLDPDRAIAKWFLCMVYEQQSRYDDARGLLIPAMTRHGRTPQFLSMSVTIDGRAGRTADARRNLDALLAISRREYVTPALLAMAYTGLDDRAHAFEWFERAYDERSNWMLFFTVHPLLDRFRDDPRYRDLAARLARPHAVRESVRGE